MAKRRHSEELSTYRDNDGIIWIEDTSDGRRILKKLHQAESPSDLEVLPHLFRLQKKSSDTSDTR